MRKIFGVCISISVAAVLAAAIVSLPTLALGENGATGGIEAAKGAGVPTNFANGDGSIVSKIINLMLYGIGVLSVVMLIMGGFRYIISGGQNDKVSAAKNTILYAIVGLLVAIFAYAIIQFVLSVALNGGGNGTDV